MCAKHASMEWTNSICQKVRQEGGAAVMDGWKDNIKNLMMRQDGEGWTVSVQAWEIPGLAIASLREVTKGDVGFGVAQWNLFLVLKHKYVAKGSIKKKCPKKWKKSKRGQKGP